MPESPPEDQEILDALAAFAAAEERDVIDRALDAARERLCMPAAFVSTITSEIQRVDQVAGDTAPFGFGPGTAAPLAETYCHRMLQGQLPSMIPDTSVEPLVHDLPATATIGAYVGVPVELADGRLHGTLCCVSGESRHGFGDDELRFMQVLAGIVAGEIDRSEERRARAADRLLGRGAPGEPAGG